MKVVISNRLHLSMVPREIHRTLTRNLQFTNPKWTENERLGRWNRGTPKILKFCRLQGPDGLVIPRGYMRQLVLLARKSGESIEIDDHRRELPPVAYQFHGQLKPFQQKALAKIIPKDFGTLSAPTGSGKTIMALHLIAHRRQPALVIVHTRELAQQWVERVHTFLKIPREEIGMIGGGKKSVGDRITIGLVQSLYKSAPIVAPHIGHLVVDECHRAPSRTFTEAVTAFDTRFMLGLSATPWRRDRLSRLIFWHLGDVHYELRKTDLVAEGHILDIEVITRSTEFKPYYDPMSEYSKMLSELTASDARNRLIAGDIAEEVRHLGTNGICLVLSDRRKHCDTLQALLKHKFRVPSTLLTGNLSPTQRQEAVARLERGEVRVLIATGQLIGEGFDHPGLATLFLTTPIRFSGRLLQYLGRVLRPSQGIERARVYDYVDIQVPALVAAARARMRVYGREAEMGVLDPT